MNPSRLLLRPLALLSLVPAPAQDPGVPRHDLRIQPRVGEPVRVAVQVQLELQNEIVAGKKRTRAPFEYASELELVDEFLALDQPAAGDFDARRTYVKWQEGGSKDEPADNEMTGVKMLITRRDGVHGVDLGDRMIRESEMKRVLAHSESVSWPELPTAVAPGDKFALEPANLVFLMLDQDREIESTKGMFTLKEVDPAGLATVEGQLMAVTKADEADSSQGTFDGTCTLVVDTRAARLQSAAWKGQARIFMDDGTVRVDGKGTFEAHVTVAAGAPAKEALARKLAFRDVPRALAAAAVAFELPSHWFSADAEEGEQGEFFSTSVHGGESLVSLQLRVFPLDGELAVDEAIDAVLGIVEDEHKLFDKKGVSSGLGKGRSVRFQIGASDEKPLEALLELYPCGRDRLLRVQLYGEAKAFEAELKAWPKCRSTLRLRS